MTTARKSLRMLWRLLLLYILTACVGNFVPDVFWLRNFSTIVLMAFSLWLMLFFYDHILDNRVRQSLMSIAGLTVFWMVLRGAKDIAFQETDPVARQIWYLYYFPAIFIPLLSLRTALLARCEASARSSWRISASLMISLALLLLVLTNDLHQLVFRFYPGFADWDTEYVRGPAFLLIYAWIALLSVAAASVLFAGCRVAAIRKQVWIPMLPVFFAVLYFIIGTLGRRFSADQALLGEFPETFCFSMSGIWLAAMYIGLVPANLGYEELFEASNLAAQIADRSYELLYCSANAAPLFKGQLSSGEIIYLNRDIRVHRKEVRGGYVYWQDDITELNQLSEELWETGERLAEAAELMRLENELKEERAQIEAKTRVYDEIAVKILPQSRRISALCARAEQRAEVFSANMREVCLLAVYIKRFANLSLLAAASPELESSELQLALQESLRYVRELEIPAEASFSESLPLSAESMLESYMLFEQLLEQALPTLKGIQLSLRGKEMKCCFEGALPVPPESCGASFTIEDGNTYLRILLRKAGEADAAL